MAGKRTILQQKFGFPKDPPTILRVFCLMAFLTIISGDVNIRITQSGFFVGRVSEGQFEYSDLNGWMTPREAAKLCEKDKKCGGFTYKVTITQN